MRLFVTGQYVTAKVPRLDPAATGQSPNFGQVVDVSGSDAQPAYKLRGCYELLKGVFSDLCTCQCSAVIQKEQVTVSPSAVLAMKLHYIKQLPRHLQAIMQELHAIAKKGCNTQYCRWFKNDLKCSIYCHKSDEYDCGKPEATIRAN